MYLQSRFYELLTDIGMDIPNLDFGRQLQGYSDFGAASLFGADVFSVAMTEVHEEFPSYGDCGCCGCGDKALIDMLKIDTNIVNADNGGVTTLFMDTVPGNSSTTINIPIGGSISGTRETSGDSDWYTVDLVAGQAYSFFMVRDGANPHTDPRLRLIDTDGTTELINNDDYDSDGDGDGDNQNSGFSFTATTTGTYYLAAEGWVASSIGDYTIYANSGTNRPDFTLDQSAFFLTHQFSNFAKWGKTALTYDVSALPAAGQAIAILAFQAWADVSGLSFSAVAQGGTADITFQEVDPDGPDANGRVDSGAFARSSTSNGNIVSSLIHVDADWTVTNGQNNYDLNSYRYQTYLHEIGHALGLGHGGPYNGGADYANDRLYNQDTWAHTVMSYFRQDEADLGTPRLVLGLQMVDIIAIQNLYGAAPSTRGGDTVYGFNSTESDVFDFEGTFNNNGIRPPSLSIYDTGGTDTLDLSGYSAHQTISLVQETFSSIGDNTNTADATDALVNLISIARGTVIENAIGGSGNDTITGNAANNIITGGAGDDVIDGGAGTDYVNYVSGVIGDYTITDNGNGTFTITSAAFGTDTVSNVEFIRVNGVDQALGAAAPSGPTENADILNGTEGNDVINALGGDDTVNGLGGNDVIDGGAGNDTLDGGAGVDRVSYASATSRVVVQLGVTTAQNTQGSGTDTLTGFEQVEGSAFNDVLYGSAGGNYILGGNGNDYIDGRGNANFMDGGAGTDWVSYRSATAGVEVDLSNTGAQATGDIVRNFENMEGSNFNDTLTGSGVNNYLDGLAGDDVINAGLGTNIIDGGTGTDTVSYAGAAGPVTVSLAITTAQNTGGAGTDRIMNVENLVGSDAADSLTGNAGDNVITGGTGNDVIDGGDGTDYVNYTSGVIGDYTITDNGNGTFTITSAAFGTDTVSNVEFIRVNGVDQAIGAAPTGPTENADVLEGTEGNDIINALGGDDTVNGLGGNDIIDGGAGNDVLDGGAGADRVSYATATSRVVIYLGNTGAQNTQGSGIDTLSGFEQLEGSAFRDVLFGNSSGNYILGGDGNDYIDGGGNANFMDGGAGTSDWVSYRSATSGVNIDLSNTGIQTTGDIIRNFENLEGSNFNDVLTDGSGHNYLDGLAGDDLINSGLGWNTIDGGVGTDTVSYANATGRVIVDLSNTAYQNTGGAGIDRILNVENLVGSDAADSLTGNAGNNVLMGGTGSDILEGGDGDDILNGGVGADRASYSTATSRVVVDLANTGAQNTQGAGVDTLVSIEQVEGSAFRDVLFGNTGGNYILGGDGNDYIDGGGNANFMDGGAGTSDWVSYQRSTNGVNVDLSNTGIQVTGDIIRNFENLEGSDFNDMLSGDSGANFVDGQDGNDMINGGAGNDTMYGGTGADMFVFDAGFGQDRIFDFLDGTDGLQFNIAGLTQFSQLSVTQSGADTLVSYDGNSVRLLNTTATDITAADVSFTNPGAAEKVDDTDLRSDTGQGEAFLFKDVDVPISDTLDDHVLIDVTGDLTAALDGFSYSLQKSDAMPMADPFDDYMDMPDYFEWSL